MSRIGKLPLTIPAGVEVNATPGKVTVKGKKRNFSSGNES